MDRHLIIDSKNISTNLLKWNKEMDGIIIFIILVIKILSINFHTKWFLLCLQYFRILKTLQKAIINK